MTDDRPTNHRSNPWYVDDTRGSRRSFHGDAPREIIDFAYAGHKPIPCPCGGQLHFRMTVGSHQCPDCRRVRNLTTGAIG